MKKIIYIILLLLPLSVLGQNSIPFGEDGLRWSMSTYPFIDSGNPNGFPYRYSGYYYEIGGDTTINNLEYSKVFYKNTWYKRYDPPFYTLSEAGNSTNPPILIGAMREDTIEKQIFYYPFELEGIFDSDINHCNFIYLEKEQEMLLYDFGMQIGDTISYFSHPPAQDESHFILMNISTTTLDNGEVRDLFTYEDLYGGYMHTVEGLGGTEGYTGLFASISHFNFEGGCGLDCLKSPTETYIGDSSIDCDTVEDFVDATDDIKIGKLNTSPNPVRNIMEIKDLPIGNYTTSIIGINGNEIISPFTRYNTTSISIDFNDLPSMLYFLHIQNEEGLIYIEKVLKQ